MELENIILSEVSQVQKTKYHVFLHIQTLDLGKKAAMLLDLGHTLTGEHIQEE
jgi:hypothetical protein